jgi:hypothetical protein
MHEVQVEEFLQERHSYGHFTQTLLAGKYPLIHAVL